MARKQTYRYRQSEKITGQAPKRQWEPIDPVLQESFLEGRAVLINKDKHWTSFDVVRKLRGLLQIKKIGHAGTLDPLATGLLIICTGKFTKKINDYMAQEKEYTGSFTLGATTATYDLESEPENEKDFSFVTPELLQATTAQFTGAIRQYPPMYSAVKKDGVALYKLARKGEEVELEARNVTIHAFEITAVHLPVVDFRIVCSTGTYIRSMAHDFGQALGCGAYLSALCRTRIGDFSLNDAMSVDAFEASLRQVE